MKKLGIEEYKRIYGDPDATAEEGFTLDETETEDCRLPKRKANTHKYSYGRALIIGGCVGFSGAPVLAANACERSGAGLTHLMVPESIYAIAAARCDGAVVTPLEADGAGALSAGALDRILPYLNTAAACAVGPGLGQGEGAHRIVEELLRRAACPLILDADALTICGKKPELLTNCKAPVVLTPHEGEFRRLGGNLEGGRLSGARRFTAEHGETILILKGYGTLIASGERVTVNPTGSPAMAKGGSGDVLCGILCALLAQGFEPGFAARAAVYLHGLAGDLACSALGEYSLTPSDLIRFLPEAFKSVCGEPAPAEE